MQHRLAVIYGTPCRTSPTGFKIITLQLRLKRVFGYWIPGKCSTDVILLISIWYLTTGKSFVVPANFQPSGPTLTAIYLLQNAARMFTSVNISEHASLPGGSALANHQVRNILSVSLSLSYFFSLFLRTFCYESGLSILIQNPSKFELFDPLQNIN